MGFGGFSPDEWLGVVFDKKSIDHRLPTEAVTASVPTTGKVLGSLPRRIQPHDFRRVGTSTDPEIPHTVSVVLTKC